MLSSLSQLSECATDKTKLDSVGKEHVRSSPPRPRVVAATTFGTLKLVGAPFDCKPHLPVGYSFSLNYEEDRQPGYRTARIAVIIATGQEHQTFTEEAPTTWLLNDLVGNVLHHLLDTSSIHCNFTHKYCGALDDEPQSRRTPFKTIREFVVENMPLGLHLFKTKTFSPANLGMRSNVISQLRSIGQGEPSFEVTLVSAENHDGLRASFELTWTSQRNSEERHLVGTIRIEVADARSLNMLRQIRGTSLTNLTPHEILDIMCFRHAFPKLGPRLTRLRATPSMPGRRISLFKEMDEKSMLRSVETLPRVVVYESDKEKKQELEVSFNKAWEAWNVRAVYEIEGTTLEDLFTRDVTFTIYGENARDPGKGSQTFRWSPLEDEWARRLPGAAVCQITNGRQKRVILLRHAPSRAGVGFHFA